MYNLTDSNINIENSSNKGTTVYHLHTLHRKFKELDGLITSYKTKIKKPEKSPRLGTTISSTHLPQLSSLGNYPNQRNKKFSDFNKDLLTTNAFRETKTNSTVKYNTLDSLSNSPPEVHFKKEKQRLGRMKDLMAQIKIDKAKKAKELRESNRLIKENVLLLKEKIIEENKMRKKVIETGEKIRKNSINIYHDLKSKYVNEQIANDLMKGFRILTKKENEVKFLKLQLERKTIQVDPSEKSKSVVLNN